MSSTEESSIELDTVIADGRNSIDVQRRRENNDLFHGKTPRQRMNRNLIFAHYHPGVHHEKVDSYIVTKMQTHYRKTIRQSLWRRDGFSDDELALKEINHRINASWTAYNQYNGTQCDIVDTRGTRCLGQSATFIASGHIRSEDESDMNDSDHVKLDDPHVVMVCELCAETLTIPRVHLSRYVDARVHAAAMLFFYYTIHCRARDALINNNEVDETRNISDKVLHIVDELQCAVPRLRSVVNDEAPFRIWNDDNTVDDD